MSVLPPGWADVPLGEICQEVTGSVTPAPTATYELYSVPSFPGLFPEVVEGNTIGSAKRSVEPSDVLLCKINPRINRVWIVGPRNQHAQLSSTEFLPLRLPKSFALMPRFLMWYLRSPSFRKWIELNAEGATGSHTRAKSAQILRQRVPLAPTAEQQRIVAAIEELISRVDAGVAALEGARRKLTRMRAAVLLAAVTGRILEDQVSTTSGGMLPDGWTLQPLGNLMLRLRNGIFVSRPVVEPVGRPILRISSVRPLALDVSDVRYVPPSAPLARAEDFVLAEGDLLFTRYSGNPEYVGACAIVPSGASSLLYPDKLIRVQVNTDLAEPRFIALAAAAGMTRQQIRRRVKTTAGQTGISGSDLKDVPFPVPPLEVQRRIADAAHERLSEIDRLKTEVATSLSRSRSLRSSILAAAFSGKLVPQDPNDESASTLLDRIRDDRAPSSGRTRTAARTVRPPRQKVRP